MKLEKAVNKASEMRVLPSVARKMAVNAAGLKDPRDDDRGSHPRGYKRSGITQEMLLTYSFSAAKGAKRIGSQHAYFVRDGAFICDRIHDVGRSSSTTNAPSELRDTLDPVDDQARSFLDIPTEAAAKLIAESQEAFAMEAAYR